MKKGIADYERKWNWLWYKQYARCGITGELMRSDHKVDMHHVLPNTKVNWRLYPHYLDSVWNLMLVLHDRHMVGALPRKKQEMFIQVAEMILQKYGDEIPYHMTAEEARKKYVMELA